MQTFKEIEAKYLLDEKDFLKLKEALDYKKMDYVVQTNHYFDTLNRDLIKQKAVFRVRFFVDYYEATIKVKDGENRLEYNEIISADEFLYLCAGKGIKDNDIEPMLLSLGVKAEDLEKIGQLTTKRYSKEYEGGTICLDKNEYNNTIDYEIELEVSTSLDDAQNILLKLFKENNITSYKKGENKITRATKL